LITNRKSHVIHRMVTLLITRKALFMLPHQHTTVSWPFFLVYPGQPVPEENFWTLWTLRKINRGRHTDHLAGRHSNRTYQCLPPPSSNIFTRRMPFLPPNQKHQSTDATHVTYVIL